MPLDFPAEAWERIATIHVPAARAQWMIEFALAWHQGAYYLRVRTYPAGAADSAHVRIAGPSPDVMRALAPVQGAIRAVLNTFTGAVYRPDPEVSAADALAHRW